MNMPLFKLPDPYRNLAHLPIDAQTLSEQLDISRKTAQRICTGQRRLKKSELRLLQVINFGLIPDRHFLRYRLSFRNGFLICHDSGLELAAGELAALYLWKQKHLSLIDELKRARARIAELEELLNPKPTNIVHFADFKR